MMRSLLLTIPLLLAPLAAAAGTPVDSAVGAILQADGPAARRFLDRVGPGDLEFRRCALDRLGGDLAAGLDGVKPLARDALLAYRRYWLTSIGDLKQRQAAEADLTETLGRLLHRHFSDIEAAEPILAKALKAQGYWSLEGKTGFLRELMLWHSQRSTRFEVALPDGKWTSTVFELDRFVSRGWSSYFTCDRTGTGGWTNPEGLYVVMPAYKSLDDERFRVNFLSHETQHFADNQRFPALKSWEKEYRAKLVELALADQTRLRVLTYFDSDQGDDPDSPHSYANKRVLIALRQRLGLEPDADLSQVEGGALRQAAAAQLRADTEERSKPAPAD
jgi:hypothetical protein